jgi:hypothetical protein
MRFKAAGAGGVRGAGGSYPLLLFPRSNTNTCVNSRHKDHSSRPKFDAASLDVNLQHALSNARKLTLSGQERLKRLKSQDQWCGKLVYPNINY